MSKTFAMVTLGCKVNQCESDAVSDRLICDGWSPALPGTPADVCIINTCTVTQKASMQSRQEIRKAVRTHPKARIIVTGCYAQTEPDAVRAIQQIHMIIGNTEKFRIPELLSEESNNQNDLPIQHVKDMVSEKPCFHSAASAFGSRTRPFVKLQDGCSAFCTYCIVPYARGKSRSLQPDHVLHQLRSIKNSGYKEAVLTGIHLGAYGRDLTPQIDLLELLRQIHACDALDRIRLSSLEPKEISDDFIRFISETDRICRHFHIPLQSGDNDVLRRMGRPYDRAFFIDRIHRIHDLLPNAAIGIDVLAGFPGETDSAFENTCSLLDDLPITYLHVFPFSPRKGTPAFHFPDKIKSSIIKQRCQKLREIGFFKKSKFYQRHLGSKLALLVENDQDLPAGHLKGISSNYIPVYFSGGIELKNTIVTVTLDKVSKNNIVFGTIVKN